MFYWRLYNQHSTVGVVTALRAVQQVNLPLIHDKGREFSCTFTLPSLAVVDSVFSEVKWPGLEAAVPRLRMNGALTPLIHVVYRTGLPLRL